MKVKLLIWERDLPSDIQGCLRASGIVIRLFGSGFRNFFKMSLQSVAVQKQVNILLLVSGQKDPEIPSQIFSISLSIT